MNFSRRGILSLWGTVLLLVSIMFLLSSWTTHFQGLAYIVTFVFGFLGYWLFIPYIGFLGISLIFKKQFKKVPLKKISFALLFLFLGLLILLPHIFYGGKELYTDVQSFFNEIQNAAKVRGGLATTFKLSGGFLGYILAGSLNQNVGGWLVILVSIVL